MTAMTMNLPELSLKLADAGYVADRDLAMALHLMALLQRPLLLEGEAGVGKTEVAKALADVHGTALIRLQCYEGLDRAEALYEWNYQRQLLTIQARTASGNSISEDDIFSERFLLERPLLQAIRQERPRFCSSMKLIAPTKNSKPSFWNCSRIFRSPFRSSAP